MPELGRRVPLQVIVAAAGNDPPQPHLRPTISVYLLNCALTQKLKLQVLIDSTFNIDRYQIQLTPLAHLHIHGRNQGWKGRNPHPSPRKFFLVTPFCISTDPRGSPPPPGALKEKPYSFLLWIFFLAWRKTNWAYFFLLRLAL